MSVQVSLYITYHHEEVTDRDVTEDLQTAVLQRPEDSSVGLQEVEGDRRDTETMVLAPCHCEHKEHVCDAEDTKQPENAGTEEVEDPNYIVKESLTDNSETPRPEEI